MLFKRKLDNNMIEELSYFNNSNKFIYPSFIKLDIIINESTVNIHANNLFSILKIYKKPIK